MKSAKEWMLELFILPSPEWTVEMYVLRPEDVERFAVLVEQKAIAAEREACRTALNVAKGALLQCSPCAAPDCGQEQREWLDDAVRCIDRRLAAPT